MRNPMACKRVLPRVWRDGWMQICYLGWLQPNEKGQPQQWLRMTARALSTQPLADRIAELIG